MHSQFLVNKTSNYNNICLFISFTHHKNWISPVCQPSMTIRNCVWLDLSVWKQGMFSFPLMTLFKCLGSKVKPTPLMCSNEIFMLFERTLTFSTIIKLNLSLSPFWFPSLGPLSHSQLWHPLHSLMNLGRFRLGTEHPVANNYVDRYSYMRSLQNQNSHTVVVLYFRM